MFTGSQGDVESVKEVRLGQVVWAPDGGQGCADGRAAPVGRVTSSG